MIRRKYVKTGTGHGVTWRSGQIYRFKYRPFENDPEPTIILMYTLEGIHPKSKRQWRFLQAINFTYIPRADRMRFAKEWRRVLGNHPTPQRLHFTWKTVKRRYPYLQTAIRRYFYDPKNRIQDPIEVPFDQMEKYIVSTYSKDFSKKVVSALVNKFRAVFSRREELKKTRGKLPKTR